MKFWSGSAGRMHVRALALCNGYEGHSTDTEKAPRKHTGLLTTIVLAIYPQRSSSCISKRQSPPSDEECLVTPCTRHRPPSALVRCMRLYPAMRSGSSEPEEPAVRYTTQQSRILCSYARLEFRTHFTGRFGPKPVSRQTGIHSLV